MKLSQLQELIRALLVALVIMTITFFLLHLAPGDPVLMLLGDLATEELIKSYREMLGLDRTLLEQLGSYVGRVFQGNLGTSLDTGQPVTSIVLRSLRQLAGSMDTKGKHHNCLRVNLRLPKFSAYSLPSSSK